MHFPHCITGHLLPAPPLSHSHSAPGPGSHQQKLRGDMPSRGLTPSQHPELEYHSIPASLATGCQATTAHNCLAH